MSAHGDEGLGQLHHLFGLGQVGGQGFFDVDGFFVLSKNLERFEMGIFGGGDGDDVDGGVGSKFLQGGIGPAAVFLAQFAGAVGFEGIEAGDLDLGHGGVGFEVAFAKRAAADDGGAQGLMSGWNGHGGRF